jgi:hypothetical protein
MSSRTLHDHHSFWSKQPHLWSLHRCFLGPPMGRLEWSRRLGWVHGPHFRMAVWIWIVDHSKATAWIRFLLSASTVPTSCLRRVPMYAGLVACDLILQYCIHDSDSYGPAFGPYPNGYYELLVDSSMSSYTRCVAFTGYGQIWALSAGSTGPFDSQFFGWLVCGTFCSPSTDQTGCGCWCGYSISELEMYIQI